MTTTDAVDDNVTIGDDANQAAGVNDWMNPQSSLIISSATCPIVSVGAATLKVLAIASRTFISVLLASAGRDARTPDAASGRRC